jgi:hypothetical protein
LATITNPILQGPERPVDMRYMSMGDGADKAHLKTCLLTTTSGLCRIGWLSRCCVCEQALSWVRGVDDYRGTNSGEGVRKQEGFVRTNPDGRCESICEWGI